jgi:hypothetical protein
VLPNARRIGVPYNNGESNARTQVESYRHDAAALGMEIVEVNAASTNEVQAATQSLVGRADTLMIIGDNTIQAALGAILKVGFDNNLPVVAADPENAKDGALTGWGILQRQAGVQSSSPRACSRARKSRTRPWSYPSGSGGPSTPRRRSGSASRSRPRSCRRSTKPSTACRCSSRRFEVRYPSPPA